MNIALQHGKSSSPIEIVSYGPDLAEARVRDFHNAYRHGTLDEKKLTQDEFASMTREGHVINCVVMERGQVAGVFGMELYADEEHGPWLSFLYYVGRQAPGVYARVMLFCLDAASIYAGTQGYEGPLWFKLYGRPGWRRVVSALGIEMSDDGWISGDQEVFRWAVKRVRENRAPARQD